MEMPSSKSSTSVLVRLVIGLIACLTRNRATQAVVAIIQPAFDALLAAAETVAAADRAYVTARAVAGAADSDLDEQVALFEGELFNHAGRSRRSGIYRKLLPQGLQAITRKRGAAQFPAVRALEENIRRELAGIDWAQARLAKIVATREEMERQMPLEQRASESLAVALAAERAAREDVRRQYRLVYAELVRLFPDNMRKANSFFLDPRGESRHAESETPPAPAAPAVAAS